MIAVLYVILICVEYFPEISFQNSSQFFLLRASITCYKCFPSRVIVERHANVFRDIYIFSTLNTFLTQKEKKEKEISRGKKGVMYGLLILLSSLHSSALPNTK